MMTRRFSVLVLLALFQTILGAQPHVDTLGPAVGARAPQFSGSDQFGRTQTLESVLGAQGAMLVFFRSADW